MARTKNKKKSELYNEFPAFCNRMPFMRCNFDPDYFKTLKTNNMKKAILTFVVSVVFVAADLKVFSQENKKAAEARQELSEAIKDSAADYKNFVKDAKQKISANESQIEKLKAKKTRDSKEIRVKYNKQVIALEQKNNELKKRIDGSATTKTSMWSSFKREFSNDMEELGQAIKNLGVDNKK